MEIVSFVIALVALVIAVLAYIRTGGIQDLRSQMRSVSTATDTLRAKTANALDRLERSVRGPRHSTPPSVPDENKEEDEKRENG